MSDSDDSDDFVLLERAREGDGEAWRLLVERHCPRVRRFLRTKVPPDALDDLTQESFVRLEQARASDKQMRSFKAFLLGITNHVFHEFVRARVRDPRLSLDDISAIDLDPRPSTLLAKKAEQALLLEGLRRISVTHQIVLELFYWEDMTAPEIAIVLEENENTIRSRIDRGRKHLRQLLVEFDRTGVVPRETDTDLDEWAAKRRREGLDDHDDDSDPA
ncbi:MAG: sigma-70 family RNA polymerase sigma factor [Deltaproteobacteria bacterium]|nr:sigma-70 family RNA polymerase sigma factor [Nannocystaceae bacterium]